MNKRKSVSCMSTSVTSLQVLEDVLEDLLADAGDQLEHHGPLHVTVHISVDDQGAEQK